MSVAANQQRTFLKLLGALRPHWRRDPALAARIESQLARHREFGSRDRKLYRELIYTTLRFLPWIEPWLDGDAPEVVRRVAWLAAESPATHAFRAEFAVGEAPQGDHAELLPGWFRAHCPEIFSGAELDAQLRRAALWLRWQTRTVKPVEAEFEARGWRWRQSDVLGSAVQLLTEANVTTTNAWRHGQIEIQDLGSQLLLETVGIRRGERWLDACAGAGGKTLQLGTLLAGGHVDAHDVRAAALDELRTRARRAAHAFRLVDEPKNVGAGAHRQDVAATDEPPTTLRILTPDRVSGEYDGVLVDAPCSGSGTWRRSPHLKWTTTEATIRRAAEIQRRLLDQFSAHVRPGGRLVYATCSLSNLENEGVAQAFLADDPGFEPQPFAHTFGAVQRGPGLLILPGRHDTDGFYVASFRRRDAVQATPMPPAPA